MKVYSEEEEDEEHSQASVPEARTVGVSTEDDPLDSELHLILLADIAQSQLDKRMVQDQTGFLKAEIFRLNEEVVKLQAQNRKQYLTCLQYEEELTLLRSENTELTTNITVLHQKNNELETSIDNSNLSVWLKDIVAQQAQTSTLKAKQYEQNLEAVRSKFKTLISGLRDRERKANATARRLLSEASVTRGESEGRLQALENCIMLREDQLQQQIYFVAVSGGPDTAAAHTARSSSHSHSHREGSVQFGLHTHRESSRTSARDPRPLVADTPPSTSRMLNAPVFSTTELKLDLKTPEDAYIIMIAKRSPFSSVYTTMYNEMRACIKAFKDSIDQFLPSLWSIISDKAKPKMRELEQACHIMRLHMSRTKTHTMEVVRKVNSHIKSMVQYEKTVQEVWKRERVIVVDASVQVNLPHPEVTSLEARLEMQSAENKSNLEVQQRNNNTLQLQIDHLQQTLHLAVRAVLSLHKSLHSLLFNIHKHKTKWTKAYTDPIRLFQLTRGGSGRLRTQDSIFREYFGEIIKLDIDNLKIFGTYIMTLDLSVVASDKDKEKRGTPKSVVRSTPHNQSIGTDQGSVRSSQQHRTTQQTVAVGGTTKTPPSSDGGGGDVTSRLSAMLDNESNNKDERNSTMMTELESADSTRRRLSEEDDERDDLLPVSMNDTSTNTDTPQPEEEDDQEEDDDGTAMATLQITNELLGGVMSVGVEPDVAPHTPINQSLHKEQGQGAQGTTEVPKSETNATKPNKGTSKGKGKTTRRNKKMRFVVNKLPAKQP